MSAELEVARRLQQMMLPKEHELTQIPALNSEVKNFCRYALRLLLLFFS
jgi:serine phosphatase RsbU (regulator of sigma subunit)